MATAPPPIPSEKKPLAGAKPGPDAASPRPPDDSVWVRYSAHGEMPMSTTISFAVHALGIGLLILLGVFVFNKSKDKPVPIEPVRYNGIGGLGKGSGVGGSGRDAADGSGEGDGSVAEGPPEEGKLTPLDVSKLPTDIQDDPDAKRAIQRGNPNIKQFAGLNESARNKLRTGRNPGGNGGDGPPGGIKGGDGGGGFSKREQRILRWRIEFDSITIESYLTQLNTLKAIIGVPDGRGESSYRAIRDLRKRPAQVLDDNPRELGLIGWYIPPSQGALCLQALGVRADPSKQLMVFFPRDLEEAFAKAEVAFRGRPEEKIDETFFRLDRVGKTFKPVVVRQTEK